MAERKHVKECGRMEVCEFIHGVGWNELPEDVRSQARRCLLDTLGVAIGGRRTDLSRIIYDFVASVYHGHGAQLWFDGRDTSVPGAVLAHGMTIDALDAHDGYNQVKGHAGVAVAPAVIATLSLEERRRVSGQELLTTLVMGYEAGLRAGKALHATACDYHTSGAWNALACAAIAARRLSLTADQTRHALGIAEYHGPRSQMMRCIDDPTMLKDGSGWGAMAGVSAALLARGGFTGAPALTVEGEEVAVIWADLGSTWLITDQYFKPFATCRWAQPAIAGALALRGAGGLAPDAIKRIWVSTFHEAVRLACRRPETTEEAQYSLPWPVAVALAYGPDSLLALDGGLLRDPQVLRLTDCVELVEDKTFNRRFPAERWARVRVETEDGAVLDSGEIQAQWETSAPTDDELREKFRLLARGSLPWAQVSALEEMVWHCRDLEDATSLLQLLTQPFPR